MLFNTKIQEIQSQVSANSLEIEALLLRVEELRAQNLAMENHLQQLGSAESAAESAIEQIKTALLMINAISPDEVQTFKGAIDSLFDCERPQLAAVDPEPEPEPEPSDDAVTLYDEYGFPVVSHEENGHNGNGYIPVKDDEMETIGVSEVESSLNKLGINDLRKLAKRQGVDSKGAKFILIGRLMRSGITEADLIA